MKTISITELHAHSEHRPPGYVDDIIAQGTLEGDRLTLSDESFAQLRRKYASSGPVPHDESELSKKRLEICQTCEDAREQGMSCNRYKGCCFGLWRRQTTSTCPATLPKWIAVKDQEADTEVPETSKKIFQSTPANMPDTINPQIEETDHA